MGRIQYEHSYEDIISVENLLGAWKEFICCKRCKLDVSEFTQYLFTNIHELHANLKNKTYTHGTYHHFKINDPKPRDIHKGLVRDRLLHHALYRKLYPFFDRTFIADSYSCRNEKGTHRAFNRFSELAYRASWGHTKTVWVLKCEKVFFYSGIDEGDVEISQEFELLAKTGCIVKTRTVFSYKRPDKTISIKCIACGTENSEIIGMGYNRKSNCDVDLTVDAMEESGPGKDFLIFTGDGDFDYLIKKVVDKGTKVYLVSSNAGIKKPGLNTKRLSTRLKDIIKQHDRGKIDLINIDSWKMKIQKEV